MVDTLPEKHIYQLIVHDPYPLWISVSKHLISENYIFVTSIISALKIQTSNQYNRNIKFGEEPSAKKYFCEMNLFTDEFIVIW